MTDRADNFFTAADRKESEAAPIGRFIIVGEYSIRDRRKTVRGIVRGKNWTNYHGPFKELIPDNSTVEKIICLVLIFSKGLIAIFLLEAIKLFFKQS